MKDEVAFRVFYLHVYLDRYICLRSDVTVLYVLYNIMHHMRHES